MSVCLSVGANRRRKLQYTVVLQFKNKVKQTVISFHQFLVCSTAYRHCDIFKSVSLAIWSFHQRLFLTHAIRLVDSGFTIFCCCLICSMINIYICHTIPHATWTWRYCNLLLLFDPFMQFPVAPWSFHQSQFVTASIYLYLSLIDKQKTTHTQPITMWGERVGRGSRE